MKRVMRVGLTGGMGSGKSSATKIFAGLGVPVIDADEISRALTKKGGGAYKPVADLFGPEAISDGGELRRDVIRNRVFSDEKMRRALEAIIHPLVYAEIHRRLREMDYPYCVISIPLLLEGKMQDFVDRVLVMDLPEERQIERAGTRDDMPAHEIQRIIHSQIPRGERLLAADDVIDNSADLDHLRSEITRLHLSYLRLAQDRFATSA